MSHFDVNAATAIHELIYRWAYVRHCLEHNARESQKRWLEREAAGLEWILDYLGHQMPEEVRIAEEWADERILRSTWGRNG